ncbi:hypothetical protein LCGC14_3006410, partial [marine sediment metagenome]
MTETFKYGFDLLTVDIALKLANGNIQGIIDNDTREKIKKNYEVVQKIV